MIDSHIHIARANGRALPKTDIEAIRAQLRRYTDRGVTAVRDGGDRDSMGLIAREAAKEIGIIYKTPIYALVKRGGYGGFIGRETGSLSEIKEALAELMPQTPDHIKVIQSGIVSFDRLGEISPGGFPKNELEYTCSFAHDRGLSVMCHCNGAREVELAVSCGADTIEHGYFMGGDALSAIRERGIVWVPTFVPLSNYLRSAAVSGDQRPVIEATLALHSKTLMKAINMGVCVALGSDAGAAAVDHGQGILDELEYFVGAGVPRDLALSMATKNGARALGLTLA